MAASRLLALALSTLSILFATTVDADTIQLRRSVRLKEAGQPVCLGDIATLEGEVATSLADTVIVPAPKSDNAFEIPLAAVRVALRDLKVNWGTINISGSKVIVRPAITVVIQPPLAMQAMTIEPVVERPPGLALPKQDAFIEASKLVLEPTLRGFVAMHVLEAIGASATDTRLAFSRNDTEALKLSPSDYRFEVASSGTSSRSDRMHVKVQLWKNGATVGEHSLLVKPLLKTQVSLLKRGVARNETIHERDLEVVTKWLSPAAIQEHADPDYAYGRVATSDLRKGDMLHTTDVRRKSVIRRGDTVTVNCLVGGHVLRCQARAQEEGAVGQMIELKKVGERNSFFALVTKPGECVLDFGQANGAPIKTSTTLSTDGI